MAYSEAVAARVRKTLAGRAGIAEKQMFGGLAFLLKGKMLIGVMGEKVLARVRDEDHDAILKPPHVKPMDYKGRKMRGWLFVTGPSIAGAAGLRKWIAGGEAALAAAGKKKR